MVILILALFLVSIVLIKKGQVIGALVMNIVCAGVVVGHPLLAIIPGTIIIYCIYLLWRNK